MENGHIEGEVSIDRTSDGSLLLAQNHIVISDDKADVICLVPYEPDGDECREYEQLAETLVARINAGREATAPPPAPIARELLERQVCLDVIDLISCNCPGPCDGSCTRGMAERALAQLDASGRPAVR